MDKESQMQEKLNILKERRSIRKFSSQQVPLSVVRELIGYASLAPSACDRQAWRFIVVTDALLKQKLVDAGGSILINKAPCGILVTYENTTRNRQYQDSFQTAGACVQNLLLAAHAYELGACWLCTLPPMAYLRKMFQIPSHYSPIAYIVLGYPSCTKVKDIPRRYASDEIIAENCFPAHHLPQRESRVRVCIERFLIWVYNRMPIFIKKKFVNTIVDKKFTKKFEN